MTNHPEPQWFILKTFMFLLPCVQFPGKLCFRLWFSWSWLVLWELCSSYLTLGYGFKSFSSGFRFKGSSYLEGPIFLADHWSTRQQAKEIPFKISAQALLHSHWRNQITRLSGKSYFRKTESSEKRGEWLFAEE